MIVALAAPADLDAALRAPVAVIYKHSPRCGVCVVAEREVRHFAERHPAVPVYWLDVVSHGRLARAVASRLGVVHESPQVILLAAGLVRCAASHWEVRAADLERDFALALDVAGADRRLVAYGTLAPGREHHHMVTTLRGTWRPCTVTGRFDAGGWGKTGGFPGLIWDPQGSAIPAHLFESPDLPSHWARLDAFEGHAYHRQVVPVLTEAGPVTANVYAVRR